MLAQTFTDFEIILVDDGSTDSTREALDSYVREEKIRYIYQEKAGGAAGRNTAMRAAKGRYFAFLDSDDLFLPQKLERQIRVFENNPGVGLVHTNFSKFKSDGTDLGYHNLSRIAGDVYPQILLEWSDLIAASSVMVPAAVMQEVGDFDTVLWSPDLEMWARIARRYPFAAISEHLTKIRVHETNISKDLSNAADAFVAYVNTSFRHDPVLKESFKKRVYARIYSKAGQNLLAEGNRDQMKIVRRHALKAVAYWPFEYNACLAFLGSLLSQEVRQWLAVVWRTYRYPPVETTK